jgi:hypothetical protein
VCYPESHAAECAGSSGPGVGLGGSERPLVGASVGTPLSNRAQEIAALAGARVTAALAAGDVVADDVQVRDGLLVAAAPRLLEALRRIAMLAGPHDGAVTLEQLERIALAAIATTRKEASEARSRLAKVPSRLDERPPPLRSRVR